MITCSRCGQSKTDYNFFRYLNRFDKTFFVAGIPQTSDVCWECAGPYRCLNCGEVKDHSHFRVMGRICDACKSANPTLEYTHKVGVNGQHKAQHPQSAENSVESGVQE